MSDILFEQLAFPKVEMEEGSVYITDQKKAYEMFIESANNGKEGLCITRRHPKKVKEKYNFNGEIVWLTYALGKDYIQGTAATALINRVAKCINENSEDGKKAVILIDGAEYMTTEGKDFKNVLKFINGVQDIVAENDSNLILAVDPKFFDEKEYRQLSRYLKII